MNPAQPRAEGIAVKADAILKVGTNKEIEKLAGKSSRVIDLNGKTVLPGFIDTHVHVADYARFLMWLDLTQANSIAEMRSLLREHLKTVTKGKWVVGRGWNEQRFAEKRLPSRQDLDIEAPGNPVIFYYECGPISLVNSKALELADITKHSPNPAGGTICKDEQTGEPNGILQGSATDLIWSLVPEPTEEELTETSIVACEKIARAGITSIHWLATSKADLEILHRLCESKKLPIRVFMVTPAAFMDSAKRLNDLNSDWARIGGVEISVDGYLAMRTASLLQPYFAPARVNATLLCTQAELASLAKKITSAGFQVVMHAMGDKAVDVAMKAMEGLSDPKKYRIDPAALLNPELITRIRQKGVIVTVQPLVAASEFQVYSALDALGAERARWLYPLKTLFKHEVCVCGGSDCPMEPLNPLLGIEWAVTREIFPEEQLTVDEALQMYTIKAAQASGDENKRGSIEEGKLADLTVLSRDLDEVPADRLREVEVKMTIIGGKVVYTQES